MTEILDDPLSTALPPTPPIHDTHAKRNGKAFGNLPIAERLLITRRALENTESNPQIADVMVRYGYDRAKMETFRKLYETAQEANIQQTKEYGDKSEAYADFMKYYQIVKVEYSNMRKFLRVVLKKDKDKLGKLQLTEAKKQSISGYLEQVLFCYQNVISDNEIVQLLAKIGISSTDIDNYRANYEEASKRYVTYFKENSEAAEATSIRDDKMDELQDFMSDFFVLAKIAFANHPDLLKQIT